MLKSNKTYRDEYNRYDKCVLTAGKKRHESNDHMNNITRYSDDNWTLILHTYVCTISPRPYTNASYYKLDVQKILVENINAMRVRTRVHRKV